MFQEKHATEFTQLQTVIESQQSKLEIQTETTVSAETEQENSANLQAMLTEQMEKLKVCRKIHCSCKN